MPDTQEQLIELETKLAFQEQTIDVLNETVIEQQRRIETLEKIVLALREQVQQLTPAQPGSPAEEPPPPHY
ncbi:MAG: SlyX family protein [Chromatiales bacterium]|nr:SlyX family protein [Chromatiales bacterium]